jgi:cell division protein ZapE
MADAMILYNLLKALFDNGVSFIMTSNYDPRLLYRTACTATASCRPSPAERAGRDERRRRHRLPRPRAGAGQAYHAAGAQTDKALRDAFASVAETADEDPVIRIEAREIRALRRRHHLVRLPHPVRRPALAERLPGNRQPFPYRDIVRGADDVGGDVVGGAPLHLADRRVLRPGRQAADVGRSGARRAVHEGAMANEFHRTVSRIVEMQSRNT